jgi:hypothetical protein
MKNLALVLLLLNLVFLSWQLVLLPQPEKTEKTELISTNTTINNHPMPSSDTPQLTLPTVPKKKPPICFHAGPYTDKEKLDELINLLKNEENINLEQFQVQTSQTRVLRSIWVYLPPFKNKQAAKRAIKSLKQAGFKDYQIIATGKFQNAISLGLYNTNLYAENRVKKLKSKGYKNIKTQKRYKNVTKYILNVKIPTIQKTLLLNIFQDKFPELLPKSVACEQT